MRLKQFKAHFSCSVSCFLLEEIKQAYVVVMKHLTDFGLTSFWMGTYLSFESKLMTGLQDV